MPTPLYSPERKPFVESFFNRLKNELLPNLPGYTKRPERADGTRYGAKIARYKLKHLAIELERYFIACNHEHPRNEEDPRSPVQIWEEAGVSPPELSDAEIRALTMERRSCQVTDKGIRIDNVLFIHPEARRYRNQKLWARQRPHDYRDVDIYDEQDRFLFNARRKDPLDEELAREVLRLR